MHKRTASNQLHSRPQNQQFNHLKASVFIPTHHQRKPYYEQATLEFPSFKNMAEKHSLKDRCKTEFQDSWALSVHKSSLNIEKFKELQEMKSSNIDGLNEKIKSLINKLSVQSSMKSSSILDFQSKVRLKTDHSAFFGQRQSSNTISIPQSSKLSNLESKKVLQPKATTYKNQLSTIGEERSKNRNKNEQLALIRLKYKNTKHQLKIKNSMILENPRKQEDLVPFKQKCKPKIKNYPENIKNDKYLINQKQNLATPTPLTVKNNINQEFSKYEKKLENYNRKRTQLLNQCKNSLVLQDLSPNTQQVYHSQLFSKKQLNCSPQHTRVSDEGQNQLPTADFRKIEETDNLTTFLSSLVSQIKLDQQFRNAKKWFARYPENQKWTSIEKQINQRSIDLDEISLKQIFTLKQDQQSPFYSFREADFTIKTVVTTFLQSEEHWFLNIVKKFDKKRLEENGFTQKTIDISGKGYISIEDFVRLINIQMNTQVRNRDLILIFQRLKSEEKLSFGDLIQVICH